MNFLLPDPVVPPWQRPLRCGRRTGVRQSGVSMIEALVALAVLAIGTVGLLRWQGAMAVASEAAREQAVAVQWLRSVLEADRGRVDHFAAGLHGAMPGVSPRPTLDQTATGDGVLATVLYTARWTDRTGTAQAWSFAAQGMAPDLATSDFFEAGLPPAGNAPRGVGGRTADVPRDAVDVDAANSFMPTTAGGLAGWVLDRHRGEVIGACAADAAPTPSGSAGGTAARDPQGVVDGERLDPPPRGPLPAGCEPLAARLVAGVVRFALGPSPRQEGPYDDPLPLRVEWRDPAGRTVTPACDVQSHRGSDPYLVWRCAVPSPAVLGVVNPVPTLRPAGWTLHGPQPTHRVCRYVDAMPAPRRAGAALPEGSANPSVSLGRAAAGGVGPVSLGRGLQRWLVIDASQQCPDGTLALSLSDAAAPAPGQSEG
jgi:Tfp pilus assembly protein PilV